MFVILFLIRNMCYLMYATAPMFINGSVQCSFFLRGGDVLLQHAMAYTLMIKQFYGRWSHINHCKNSKLKLMDHSIETGLNRINNQNMMHTKWNVNASWRVPSILLVLRCQIAFNLICSKLCYTFRHLRIGVCMCV